MRVSHFGATLQIFIAVGIGRLHSQPFTNSHHHFLNTVKLTTFQTLLQQHKQMQSNRYYRLAAPQTPSAMTKKLC
jgi:hypothetical protein